MKCFFYCQLESDISLESNLFRRCKNAAEHVKIARYLHVSVELLLFSLACETRVPTILTTPYPAKEGTRSQRPATSRYVLAFLRQIKVTLALRYGSADAAAVAAASLDFLRLNNNCHYSMSTVTRNRL